MKKSFHYAHTLLQKYGWNSIFVSYFKRIYFFLLAIFLIISCLIYAFILQDEKEETNQYALSAISQTKSIINKFFYNLDNYTHMISGNTTAKFFLYNDNIFCQSKNKINAMDNLHQLMSSYMLSSDHLDSIYLYSFKSDYVLATKGSNTSEKFYNKKWLEYYNSTKKSYFVIDCTATFPGQSTTELISCCYCIYDIATPIGLVVYNINSDALKRIINVSDTMIEDLNITDENGNLIFSLNSNGKELYKSFTYNNFHQKNITKTALDNGLTMYTSVKSITTPKIPFMVIAIFFLCIIMALALIAIISFYISMHFYHSIQEIVMSLQTTESNNLQESGKENELMYILKNIKATKSMNSNYKTALTEQISEIKKLQSYALQLQFNPHFLFNTLNIANLSVIRATNGNSPASRILILLSDLLKIALDSQEYIVTIEKEIIYVKKFLDIQSIRDDCFDVFWDIPENFLNKEIPKLILQPILENAFEHGIKYLYHKKRGMIKISAEAQNDIIKLTIINNGPGMDAEQLKKVREQLKTNDIPGTKNIGLCNVNRRIKLIYGENYGVDIESSDQAGTTIIIKIPNGSAPN